jgi:hypothetical protein
MVLTLGLQPTAGVEPQEHSSSNSQCCPQHKHCTLESCNTIARKLVDTVHTAAVVGASLPSALVDVGFARGTRVSSITFASELIDTTSAAAVVGALIVAA